MNTKYKFLSKALLRTQIQIPLLPKTDVTAYYAQMRPTRLQGNRLDKEQVLGKCIIHNYGHGGAGVSLAPGSAIEAVKLTALHLLNKTQKVAVIGAGVIGLMNALVLTDKYPFTNITVYAERIPTFGQKDNSKLITSEVAPGFWLPYAYGNIGEAEHKLLSGLSYQYYLELSRQEEYKESVKQVGCYDILDQEYKSKYFDVLTDDLLPSFQKIKLKINSNLVVDCRYFKTIKIDMQPFLRSLIDELKRKGVAFVNKKINLEQMRGLSQKVIFNCTALGARELFDQKSMKGVKGHLIEYRNPNPSQYDFILMANVGSQMLNYYMHPSRIILGLTRESEENSDVNWEKINILQSAHDSILAKFGIAALSPKL